MDHREKCVPTSPSAPYDAGADPSRDGPPRSATEVPVGRFWSEGPSLHWTGEVYAMHGFEPAQVVPTVDLMVAHADPADRDLVARLLLRTVPSDGPRADQYRLVDTGGSRHWVAVTVEHEAPGTVRGQLIDLTARHDRSSATAADEMLAAALDSRAVIDQAKGALQLVYGLQAEEAFDLLRWYSQQHNQRVRTLAEAVLEVVRDGGALPAQSRRRLDELLGAPGRTGAGGRPRDPVQRFDARLAAREEALVLTVTGEVDLPAVPALAQVLRKVATSCTGERPLLVDLTACDFIGPAGVGELVAARRRLAARGSRLHVVARSVEQHPAVQALLPDVLTARDRPLGLARASLQTPAGDQGSPPRQALLRRRG